MNLIDKLVRREDVIIGDNNVQLDAKDIVTQINNLEQQLKLLGRHRIGLYLDNSINWVLVDLACQQANICLVPLPLFFSPQQLQAITIEADLDGIICDSELQHCLIEHNIVCSDNAVVELSKNLLIYCRSSSKETLNAPHATQKITFTSGSTGKPKGVCLSSKQQLQQAKAIADVIPITRPVHMCLLPLSTLLENIAGVYVPLLMQGKLVIPSLQELGFSGVSIDINLLLKALEKYQPTSIIIIPQLLQLLISAVENGWHVPESLQFIAVGGARVSPKLKQHARSLGLNVFEGYGLSECVSVVSLEVDQHSTAQGSGKILQHLEATIEQGELVVAGNSMLGYLNMPHTWHKKKIYTGDIAQVGSAGHLSIQGRKKNLIISSFGRNISPEWIESEILVNTQIRDCVVFGDEKPYCVALINLDPRLIDNQNKSKTIEHYLEIINSQLPEYAQIKAWFSSEKVLSDYPKLITENGRVKRKEILKYFEKTIEGLYQPVMNITNMY